MSPETEHGRASVTLMCQTFGISRAGLYAARRREGSPRGDSAAVVIPMKPRRPEWTSSEVLLPAIERIAAENPAWGVRKVWATLRREGLSVSRKRVHALMRAQGLVLARDSEPGEPRRTGHVAVASPNRRWATDFTTTWTRQDGVVAIVPVIDCGCRSVLSLSVTKAQDAPHVLAPVYEALEATFGVPENVPMLLELRTDHGPQYTGSDAESLVEDWALEHTFAPVGRPTGNAVVERLNRTMKEEVVWLQDWESARKLAEALETWVAKYNFKRPHQALGWQTPAEYRAAHLGEGREQRLAA